MDEAHLNTCSHVVCDNIDLDTILVEYENYYYLRYQKKPKISKPLDAAVVASGKMAASGMKNAAKTAKQQPSLVRGPARSLDTSFVVVNGHGTDNDGDGDGTTTPEREEEGRRWPSSAVDLGRWKDEWRVYAEIVSKVMAITNNNMVNNNGQYCLGPFPKTIMVKYLQSNRARGQKAPS